MLGGVLDFVEVVVEVADRGLQVVVAEEYLDMADVKTVVQPLFGGEAAHGTSIFAVFTWADQGLYPGWLSTTNENLMNYYTDYSLLRVSAGVLQVQNAKLDALADAFLKTVPVSNAVAVYWPTASTINAMPLDVITLNRDDQYHGIIPTIHWMLYGRGIGYRYVFEQAVLDGKEDLSKISVLIMPYAAWLPEEVSSLLTSWVKEGGALICAGPVGAETPYGFKDGRTMREVFGKDFAVAHVDGTEWKIFSPSKYTDKDVVEATFGKGRVVMTTSGSSTAKATVTSGKPWTQASRVRPGAQLKRPAKSWSQVLIWPCARVKRASVISS